MDLTAAFNTWAERSKVAFDDDRTATVGGSEIGGCAKQVGYKKSSTPVDVGHVDGGGFAARGNVMEDAALVPVLRMAIEADGGTLLWAGQAEQMRLVNAQRRVSVTPDGLAINMPKDCLKKHGVEDITNGSNRNSGCVYVELKSIDPRVAVGKLPKDQHVDQVNLGMGMVRETEFEEGLDVASYSPNYAVIIYMNASDYSDITVCVVAFDEDGYRGQLLRAKNIMDAAAQGLQAVEALRPEGKIAGGGDCRYCAFSKRCIGYAAMVPKVTQLPDKKVVKKIRALAGKLKSAKDKSDLWDLTGKKFEADLKEELIRANTKWLDLGDVKMNWNASDGRENFDTDAAKKKLVDLGCDLKDFVKRTKPSESLRIEYVKQLAVAN
jgi:hypothetical protein